MVENATISWEPDKSSKAKGEYSKWRKEGVNISSTHLREKSLSKKKQKDERR